MSICTFQELSSAFSTKYIATDNNPPDKATFTEIYVLAGEHDRADRSAPEAVGNACMSPLESKYMLVVDDTLWKSLCSWRMGGDTAIPLYMSEGYPGCHCEKSNGKK